MCSLNSEFQHKSSVEGPEIWHSIRPIVHQRKFYWRDIWKEGGWTKVWLESLNRIFIFSAVSMSLSFWLRMLKYRFFASMRALDEYWIPLKESRWPEGSSSCCSSVLNFSVLTWSTVYAAFDCWTLALASSFMPLDRWSHEMHVWKLKTRNRPRVQLTSSCRANQWGAYFSAVFGRKFNPTTVLRPCQPL